MSCSLFIFQILSVVCLLSILLVWYPDWILWMKATSFLCVRCLAIIDIIIIEIKWHGIIQRFIIQSSITITITITIIITSAITVDFVIKMTNCDNINDDDDYCIFMIAMIMIMIVMMMMMMMMMMRMTMMMIEMRWDGPDNFRWYRTCW